MTFEEAVSRHLAPTRNQINRLFQYASEEMVEGGSLFDHYSSSFQIAFEALTAECLLLHEIHKTEILWVIEGALVPASARRRVALMQDQGYGKVEMIKRTREHLRNRGLHSAARLYVARGVVESVLSNWCLEMFPAVQEEEV